jgi:hypothetical protein
MLLLCCFLIVLEMPVTALHRFGKLDLVHNERIIFRTHAYFISFIREAVPGVVGIIVGFSSLWLFYSLFGFSLADGVEITSFVFLIAGIPLLWGVYVLLRHFIDWQFDEAVVTNKRVIFMDHEGLFDRGISSVDYDSICDVVVHQSGFLRTIFRVGTIDVKTSASMSDAQGKTLIIREVYHPKRIHKLIDMLSSHIELRNVNPDDLLLECGLMEFGDLGKGVKRSVKRVMKRKRG